MINNQKFQPIIGLEIHIELATSSKMFCSCPANHFGKPPNTQTCPTCLGLPGALPVANAKAIEWTVMAGLALDCQIPLFAKFDRKNYFYPDLPKGYQISQYDLPFAINGKLNYQLPITPGLAKAEPRAGNYQLCTRIRRVHLEEDTGKLVHRGETSLIDFNRSGVPLMELVTEPDIRSAKEAKFFLKKLHQIVRYLGISDCDMEKGSMRIEPNVSVLAISNDQIPNSKQRPNHQLPPASPRRSRGRAISDDELPSYKVEVKNINSFRYAEKAINYEIVRQIKILEKGQTPVQETRGWDEVKNVTFSQRSKEEAMDYRYFPEPDLPPIQWKKQQIKSFSTKLPELPEVKIGRWVKKFRILNHQADFLAGTKERAKYFEKAIQLGKARKIAPVEIAKAIINWPSVAKTPSPETLINNLIIQKNKPTLPDKELKKIVAEIIAEFPSQAEEYREGKKAVIEFFVGQVMKKSRGQANAKKSRKLLKIMIG